MVSYVYNIPLYSHNEQIQAFVFVQFDYSTALAKLYVEYNLNSQVIYEQDKQVLKKKRIKRQIFLEISILLLYNTTLAYNVIETL